MKVVIFPTIVLALLPAMGVAADDPAHIPPEAHLVSASDAPLKLTINPEERVSVLLAGPLPHSVPCGTPVDLPVRIVNLAFTTAQLEAHFVGDAPAGVSLEFHPEPLTGAREELRHLQIILTKPGPTDLTIAFKPHKELPDLGGRDRVHFLINCL